MPIPKPLIKTNPKMQQQQQQQQPREEVHAASIVKEQPIENEAIQKQGRGNCYTEPMHPNNCVQSELYLIT